MAEAKQKTTTTMKMSATCPHHARSDISVRDVESVIDEPTERGGTNLGLTPTETMVAALIGCTNVITQRISEGYDLHIDGMEIDVEAEFDRRGVMLKEAVKVPFPRMTLNIHIKTPNDASDFDKVKEDLQKFCPIAMVIRESGTVIDENWTFTKS
tara:strand:+ start:769 stop:1233 length:465 start_codon:yes stop_codon:yes gene_type:complete